MTHTPIAKLLKRGQITSADIEAAGKVSRQTVHNWRTGKNEPRLSVVAKIIKSLRRDGHEIGFPDFFESTAWGGSSPEDFAPRKKGKAS